MAIAYVDVSDITEFRKQLEALPAELERVAGGIAEDEAKRMAAAARTAYRDTYAGSELAADVVVEQTGRGRWRVFNASGFAHWFEYAPGTAMRWTKEAFTATRRRRARKQAGGAYRGQIKVQASGETVGGFSGQKATPTTQSTAIFRPIFIPLALRHRRSMVQRLIDLVRSKGFTVSGDADTRRAA
jgi:hypothetical protein